MRAVRTYELFAAGTATPEEAWALVGDPRRLAEWTDVIRVEGLGPEPIHVGTTFTTVVGDEKLRWRVVTAEAQLWEVVGKLSWGRVGFGARVAPDPLGSRVILAYSFKATTRAGALRYALGGAAALRRRLERWADTAQRRASVS